MGSHRTQDGAQSGEEEDDDDDGDEEETRPKNNGGVASAREGIRFEERTEITDASARVMTQGYPY